MAENRKNYEREPTDHPILRNILLGGVAVVSFFGVMWGVNRLTEGGGFPAYVTAVLIAAALAGGPGLLYHLFLVNIPRMKSARQVAGVTLASGVTLLLITVATWLMATGLGGRAAVDSHLQEFRIKLQREADAVYERAGMEQEIAALLRRTAAEVRLVADAEAGGSRGGPAGKGPKYQALVRISSSWEKLAADAEAAKERMEALSSTRIDQFRKLDELIATRLPPGEKQQKFATLVSDIRTTLSDMGRQEFLPSIRAGVGLLEATNLGGTVKADLDERARRLQVEADRLMRKQERLRPEPVVFTQIWPGEAVIAYADRIAVTWLIAIMVDAMPWILLIFMIIRQQDPPDSDDQQSKPQDRKPDLGNEGTRVVVPMHPAE